MWLTAIAGLLLAAPAFAQGTGAAAASGGVNWVALTSGFAKVAIASWQAAAMRKGKRVGSVRRSTRNPEPGREFSSR